MKIQEYAKKLDKERRIIFHTYVMEAIFLCKIEWPDVDQGILFLF